MSMPTTLFNYYYYLLHPFNGLFSRQEMMGFWNAVASAGPYANNLHLAADR